MTCGRGTLVDDGDGWRREGDVDAGGVASFGEGRSSGDEGEYAGDCTSAAMSEDEHLA